MVKWKIYYADGWSYTDSYNPLQIPRTGVQVIAVNDLEVGRRLIFSHSYYVFKSGEWLGVDDTTSLVLHLLKDIEHITVVLAGLIVDQKTFRECMKRAKEDTYI